MNRKTVFVCLLAVGLQAMAQTPVYLDESKPVEQRIEDALKRMTLPEKIAVIHAQSKFSSAGVKRLGFPDFWTADGPPGWHVRRVWPDGMTRRHWMLPR